MRRAFTMIEVVVAIGLMVVIMAVLAFVFKESADAVAGSTEAVAMVQNARAMYGRMSREIGHAVQYYDHETARRGFWMDGDVINKSGDELEFVSQTTNDGELGTWDVRYRYVEAEQTLYRDKDSPFFDLGDPGNPRNGSYRLWDHWYNGLDIDGDGDIDEYMSAQVEQVLAHPVVPMLDENDVAVPIFAIVSDPDRGLGAEIMTRLPAAVRVRLVFIDSRGGQSIRMPMQFYFPIFQGQ